MIVSPEVVFKDTKECCLQWILLSNANDTGRQIKQKRRIDVFLLRAGGQKGQVS